MRRTALLVAALAAALAGSGAVTTGAGAKHLEWRGIVEGAYGRPWTHAERMRVLRWMPAHGFNAYVHAPKDDLYQRTSWRDPYPADQQRELEREIRLARRRGIEWIPNLSPAVPLIPTPAAPAGPPSRDLCFSCPEDLEAVVAKLRAFLGAGSRAVMISFDDVAKLMTHPQDLERYGEGDEAFGKANGDFLTRLRERLGEIDARIRVLTVGADYFGTADTAYLRGLRSTLGPGIEVMWTGTNVPSEHWKPEDARAYGELIGRVPVVWENWTNNDTAGSPTPIGAARIFLGPYKRGSPVAGAVRGFFFNPANEADLNLLPLATAGEWMRDPRGYRPRASWLDAIRELAPERGPGARRRRRASFRAWAETSWSNKLDREREAPSFVRHSGGFLAAYEDGAAWTRPYPRLVRELRLVERAPERVARLPDRAIAEQAKEFLDNARVTARAGHLATDLLASERPALEVAEAHRGFRGRAAPPDPSRAAELRGEMSEAERESELDDEFTYGWRTPFAFEIPPYPVPENVMSVYLERVRALDEAWQPRSERAASSVEVSLDGEPVPVQEDGTFRLPRGACGGRLVAIDGAGGKTAVPAPCPAGHD